jgi:flagellin-specific chaperone FliS
MASLDEIRKRFGKTSLNAMDDNGGGGGSLGAGSLGAGFGLTDATLKIFDPLKKFEVQVSEIAKAAEPLERVLNQTARAVDEIKVFHTDMERLAKAYDGIRTFQAALNADGARELREQFDAIAKIFYENLSTVAALLDPAREFQARISELSRVFDGLKPLQEQFTELAKKFKPEVAENPKTIVLEQASAAKPFSPTATVVR